MGDDVVVDAGPVVDGGELAVKGNPWNLGAVVYVIVGLCAHLVVQALEGTLVGWGLHAQVIRRVPRESLRVLVQLPHAVHFVKCLFSGADSESLT